MEAGNYFKINFAETEKPFTFAVPNGIGENRKDSNSGPDAGRDDIKPKRGAEAQKFFKEMIM